MSTFTIPVSRVELQWFFRQFKAAEEKAQKLVTPPASPTTDVVNLYEETKRVALMLADLLDNGKKNKLELESLREELQDARQLVGGDKKALQAIKDRLEALPKEEDYKITFDRDTAKFAIKLLEKDIQSFFGRVIPNTEAKPDSDFPDPVQTKTYWINRAKRARDILEALKIRLEKHI